MNTLHKSRPDGDNLEKYFIDAMTGLIFADDCEISWVMRSKSYTSDMNGETVAHFLELPPEYIDYGRIEDFIIQHLSVEEGDEPRFKD